MTNRQRKEKALELAASIIALTIGEDVEMTIIVREPAGDDGNITLRSTIDTAGDIARETALPHAAQHTAVKER